MTDDTDVIEIGDTEVTALAVLSEINHKLSCPGCGTSMRWRRAGRADVRLNSVIYRFRCDKCGEQIVTKLARSHGSSATGGGSIRREHEVLRKLQGKFSPNQHLRVLTPLVCVEVRGEPVLVTRWFDGKDAIQYARDADPERAGAVYRSAGELLRKLHDAHEDDRRIGKLDVEQNVDYLQQEYGAYLRVNHRAGHAFRRLRSLGARLAISQLPWSWTHGDFKPENVLCDGRTVVMLDMQLSACGAVVYDLASYLDHVLLNSCAMGNRAIRDHYRLLESEFLAGYGLSGAHEIAALRWAQLYFMLCYFGRYRSGSILSAVYAHYRVGPLLARLTNELDKTLE